LGARSKHQRAADLAAVSGAQVMSRNYSRLFEPAVFENGLPNPHHLSNAAYLALARAAALRGACRNDVPADGVTVKFPGAGFAPTQIEIGVRGDARLSLGDRRERERVRVQASATAEITPDLGVAFGMPTHGSGGGYDGPLAYRMGKPNPYLFSALPSRVRAMTKLCEEPQGTTWQRQSSTDLTINGWAGHK
jgi:hypothetical protein